MDADTGVIVGAEVVHEESDLKTQNSGNFELVEMLDRVKENVGTVAKDSS